MAADNVVSSPGSGGAIFRAFSDGTNEWPVSVIAWVTGGSSGNWTLQEVTGSNGLPVSVLGTVPVSGTFWQTTQPVSIAATVNTSASQSGTWNITVNTALPAGTATIGGVELVDSAGTNKASISAAGAVKVDGSAVTQPVSGTFWQATQPVSGTVTANAGSGTFAVTDAGLNLAQASTTSGQDGPLIQGAVTTSAPTYTTAKTNPLSLTTAGALRVDASATTQPVSGTFWQTTQPVSGTFWQTTQPVSIAATVTTSDLADGPVTPGTAATKSVLIGAQYNSSAPAPTTGQQVALQMDSSGNLKVNVAAGGGSGGTSSTFSAAFPGTGTAAGASDGTNMKPLLVDASGFLKVNVAAGSGGNGAASATGSAVPTDADYGGINVGGTLRGQTGVNPTGTVYAAQTDLSSVGGTSVALGQTTMSASIPVAIASNQSAIPASQSGSWTVTANAGTGTFNIADANLELAQGSTTSGQVGPLIQGAVTTAAPTYTTAKTNPLSLTTAGALRVDGSAVTQPVSGTVTANAGTGSFTVAQATAANLNATVVGTVTANAGTGTFNIADANLELAQASTTSGQVGPLIQGAVTTSAPTYTTAKTNPLSLTTAGALRVDGSAVTQPVSGTFWQATQPVSGTVTANAGTGNFGANITQVGGSTVSATNPLPVEVSDGTNVLGTSSHPVRIDPTGTTTQPVSLVAAATGGATPYHYLTSGAANQDSANVKATAGTVYSVAGFNTNASARYLKLYDKATAPTSTDTPKQTFLMPGNTSGAGFTLGLPVGMAFSSGIGHRVTTGMSDSDTGAAATGDVAINLTYN